MTIHGVFNITAARPFVDDLAVGIAADAGTDPLALARYRILLPTRRACRSLREAFLRLGAGDPVLLPRMTPIGDVDEEELVLELEGSLGADAVLGDLPPAIPALRRQLILTEMVRKRDPEASPDQCALLARELARLIDQVATERLDFADLAKLADGDHAAHWQKVLRFLEIVTAHWPAILEQEGAIDPAERRNRLLDAQAAAWRARAPDGPVIAAGSTGSIPATADLLAVVATLPMGAVVLPGLDHDMDDNAWASLGPSHPQFGLSRLIDRLEIERGAVADWPARATDAARRQRVELLSRALTPATAITWPASVDGLDASAMEGVSRIDCPDPVKEAEIIALALREALETPARTAALVTPDRDLARRVAAELARWGIAIDDSAGRPLGGTLPGGYVRLIAAMLASDIAPVPLLGVLKHPLAAGGESAAGFHAKARALEIAALRGPRPASGWRGLKNAIGNDRRLAAWVDGLADMTRPLSDLMAGEVRPLNDLVRAHVAVAEALAADDVTGGGERLWAGDAGEALTAFFAELDEGASRLTAVSGRDYGPLLDTLLQGRVVRPKHGRHPRLNIWGPLEARLQHADTVILGGLNEGNWPPQPDPGPWMSRPMMAAFGLPSPERRVGLSAHDFAQAFAAPRIILTRSARSEGAPTVASRWLQRIDIQIRGSGIETALGADRRYLELAEALDRPRPDEIVRPEEPRPRPPLAARPAGLSVTQIETWLRDPYAIYARHILKLEPLKPIDADPDAAERGNLFHEALERFIGHNPVHLPDDAERQLIDIGRDVFRPHLDRPGVRAFWWPRFLRVAHWFAAHERRRRNNGIEPLAIEQSGRMTVEGAGPPFELRARADRIDRLATGDLAIVDYKTGQAPSAKEVAAGLAPQLPLEAAIVESGGFDALGESPPPVERLEYWQLSGGRVAGAIRDVSEKTPAGELSADALAGLKKWIAYFAEEETAYISRRRPKRHDLAGDYDHLARVREWAGGDEETGE